MQGNRSPGTTRLSTLVVYGYYRVFLAAALLLVYIVNADRIPYHGEQSDFYLQVTAGYFVVALLSTLLVRVWVRREWIQGLLLVATDICALTLMAYASGSGSAKVAPLLVVTVAAGAILLQGRLSFVVAAVATLAMLYQQVLSALASGASLTSGSTEAGLLGLAFFGVVVATNQLTARLQQSEALASLRTEELIELEELNAHIIQRMRTGILVVDDAGVIRLSNTAAMQMLVPAGWQGGTQLDATSPELLRRIDAWHADQAMRFPPFRNHALGPEIDASLTSVRIGDRLATLVFLEDLALMSQQLQQMKLASLGRLTASIAHEIRNPLSAINHAAQLLSESPNIAREDVRLTEIVQQQALRLDRIVENVLQLSRRQTPRSDLLELGSWLRQFRTDYLATHTPGDFVDVVTDESPQRARFDPHHLQQILQNLCDNGLRHGRALAGEGRVTLQVVNGRDGEAPLLRIIDNGAGIGPDKIGNLFEPFYTTDAKGTGLGLYIARELCEANRARLAYVAAKEGESGYFQITFAHPGRIAN